MKDFLIQFFKYIGLSVGSFDQQIFDKRKSYLRGIKIFNKYRQFTMIPDLIYLDNLNISETVKNVDGAIVECGVWRGGMIAGISEILGSHREYWLFDSFEGLPPAKEIDGEAASSWQKNVSGKFYYDNCKAEKQFAENALQMAGVANPHIEKGWFKDTVPPSPVSNIALLRLDGDWYESTMVCLEHLYPKVADNGVVIIDDYYQWDGCTKAVHDYLSKNSITDRISQSPNGVAYIIKNKQIIEPK